MNGQRAVVRGTERHGIREACIDNDVRLRNVQVANAVASEFVLTRVGVERVLQLGSVRVRERVFVPDIAPVVVCEWRSDAPVDFELAWLENGMGTGELSHEPQSLERRAAALTPWQEVRCRLRLLPGVALQLTAGTLQGATADSLLQAMAARRQRRDSELLKVELPVPELTDAMEWAKDRLSCLRLTGSDVWAALAALATGDFARVKPLLDSPGNEQQRVLRAFWGAWTGASGSGPDDRIDVAPPLRDAADAAWREYAAGNARNGFAQWQEHALLCYTGEKGAWADAHATARVINGLVYGLLGAAPDAARGRLRVRPQIPKVWSTLVLRGLNVGENHVSMRYTRSEKHISFEWTQDSGAYPLRLIFEPGFQTAPKAARVDGRNAELDRRAFGESVLTPVQLVLDHTRRVEFEFA